MYVSVMARPGLPYGATNSISPEGIRTVPPPGPFGLLHNG